MPSHPSIHIVLLRRILLLIALFGSVPPGVAAAQSSCPRGFLPAYAHNDYGNSRPLHDALALGYLGVEADVFLIDGALRVGHDRREARRSGTLREIYLEPLRVLVGRCGTLTADGQPFLFTLELKEHSRAAYDSVVSLLARYDELLDGRSGRAPIEVVLVGWHPPLSELHSTAGFPIGVQHRLTRPDDPLSFLADTRIRLISIDYGKTIGRWWVTAARRERWLAAIRAAKAADPERQIRVHNVPLDRAVYQALLAAGVDLIGTKQLAASRTFLLSGISPASSHPASRIGPDEAVRNPWRRICRASRSGRLEAVEVGSLVTVAATGEVFGSRGRLSSESRSVGPPCEDRRALRESPARRSISATDLTPES